jgi:uncharacterized membrane-anchored protein
MALKNRVFSAPKVPEVFLIFWVVKLLTTGIGETSSDFLGTYPPDWFGDIVGFGLAAVIGVGGFFGSLVWQMRATTYHPLRYWITVLFVAVFGTMIADTPHVILGTPYYVDATIYAILLAALLTWWKRSEGTFDIHSIVTSRRERFYWGTVLMTFGLGTALGDTTATNLNLGYWWSVLVFAVLILVPLVAWRMGANGVVCFWISYALTRPLGASVADGLAVKTTANPPGLGWTTGVVTLLGLVVFAILVAYLVLTHADEEGAHAAHAGGDSDHRTQAERSGTGRLDAGSAGVDRA